MQYLKATGRRIRGFFRTPRMLRSWTLTSKVVLFGIVISLVQNMLYGLFPCHFSMSQRKFMFCKPMFVYCFVIATSFGVFYVSVIWEEYSNEQIDQRDAIKIYCYMNVCICLLNYVTQWIMLDKIVNFQNSIPLFSTINYFDISLISTWRAIILACLKLFVFPCLLQMTLVLYQKKKQPELSLLNTGKTMLPIFLGNQINNCFFGGIVITITLLAQINIRLREILNEGNRLQTSLEMQLHKSYYRMQRFCDLADRLDELAHKYTLTTTCSMSYLVLTAYSMVISMAINLISTTLGFYTQYQAFADYIMLEEVYDVSRALAHLVFLLVPFLEILLVARVSQQVLDEARTTGNLLQRMNVEHADVRFKQVVDAFWLEVCTIKYKLMPMGLLELNGSMINKIFSTVAGFLLFLIQNDLTLRFSLK